ncbi:Oxygen regulatory protein NreC [termite gut metagenome]|uniref:Oxygen regulatory protein NreC n=1 Tax=termite gut metagenome TaxID=433724 RepID=A0A5J4PH52_9ZZZZ
MRVQNYDKYPYYFLPLWIVLNQMCFIALIIFSFPLYLSILDDLETLTLKISRLQNIKSAEGEENDNTENLSLREKEIVVCIVKGMMNKEIAEKLFLSIHTIITHRRNISKKLQIHSTAGLTIYAIVNKLIELKDIEERRK